MSVVFPILSKTNFLFLDLDGGMENPCMNFLSPTILAGDRSLISISVHELIHSWTGKPLSLSRCELTSLEFSGNLVTNENWEHFWLNEGITSFIETKLLGILAKDTNGEVQRFYAAQQWEEMETDIHDWGLTHPYTCLVYRLNNVDPDDAYSSGKNNIEEENEQNKQVFFPSSTIFQRSSTSLAS